MAKFYLENNDVNQHISNKNTSVYGANATESVIIDSGVTGTIVDQNVEAATFATGSTTDYKYAQSGNKLKVYAADGTTLVADVALNSAGTPLTFSNGTVTAAYSTTGVINLGGKAVTSTATLIDVAATVDNTKTSGGTGGINNQVTTLTAGADNFTGTVNADTFSAYIDAASTTDTLTGADQLNGGQGTDTIYIVTDGSGAGALPGASIQNIENFYIREVGGTAGSYDFGTVTGEQQIWSDRATDAVTFDNLAAGTTVGLNGDGSTVLGNVTFNMVTNTDAVSIAIANGVGATGTAPNITEVGSNGIATTATISSTGAANIVGTVDLANATLTSITVNAATNLKGDFLSQTTDQVGTDGAVIISGAATAVEFTTALDNSIKTINASGLTAGGLKATLGTGTQDYKGGEGVDTIILNSGVKTATFGSGNDVVTTAAVAATAAGAIDGGNGTDTLIIAATSDVNSAAKRAVYTSFEVLRNTVGGANIDLDSFGGVVAVESQGNIDTTFSNLSATQAGSVKVIGAATTLTLSLKDGSDTRDIANVTIGDGAADSDILTNLSADKFETINIVSTGKVVGLDLTVQKITSDSATAINISGSVKDGSNAVFKLADLSGLSKAVSIDASGITDGSITLGAANASLIKGSTVKATAVADDLTTGLVTGTTGDFVVYNAGAGADTIRSTAAILNNSSASNGSIKINGEDGSDTLVLTDSAGLTISDAQLQFVTGVEKISYTVSAQAATITTGGFFNTNFSTGVEVTLGEATTGGVALSFDSQSYTSAATVKAYAAGASNGSVNVKTGSGNDSVSVTTNANFGDTAQGSINIETGLGNDTVDLTGVADAGAGAGAVTVTTGAGDDTIKGVAVDATITPGVGVDNITVSSGAQVIVIGDSDSGITVSTADTITGFTTTTDDLKMGTAGAATGVATTDNYSEASAAVSTFAAALTAANTALALLASANTGSVEAYNLQWDATNGYLFNDTDGNGTADQVVVLVGITASTFAAGDIIV